MEKTPKIFISHSSKDQQYAELMIDLLHGMGQCDWNNSVFCSSIAGYDIPLRSRIFDHIKKQFDAHELYVLFLLSKNFYDSPASLNEMGATWITNQPYCMILLPGFSFEQIEGVVDSTLISIDLNQSENWSALNKLRDDILSFLKIKPSDQNEWERTRHRFTEIIQQRREEKQVHSHETDPLDIQIIKFLASKGEEGASFSEIASIDSTRNQLEIRKRLDFLVEQNKLKRTGDSRNSKWYLANNNQMDIILKEIIELKSKVDAMPDPSQLLTWEEVPD